MRKTPICLTTVFAICATANAQTITSATGVDLTQIGDLLSGVTTNLNSNVHEQNQHVAFAEGVTTLSAPLITNTGSIASGVSVSSFYFHFDNIGASAANSGSITFDNNVLGVIWSNGYAGAPVNLNPSNSIVGVSGVTYFPGSTAGTVEL